MNLWTDPLNAFTGCECVCVALCAHAKPETVLDRVRYAVPYFSTPDWHQACVSLEKCHEYHKGIVVITSQSVLLVVPSVDYFCICALVLGGKCVEWNLNVLKELLRILKNAGV